MRGYFAYELSKLMSNKDIYLLFADLGYAMLDSIREKYPERSINTGASEQTMLDMAVGLAYEGKIPVVYSITPFLLYRPFETIRTYINHEKLGVKLIGGGRDRDYEHDGISHFAHDDREIMRVFRNIRMYHPESKEEITKEFVKGIILSSDPVYLNLKR